MAVSLMYSFPQHPLTEYRLHFMFALFQGGTHTVWWGRHGNVSEPGGQMQAGKEWGWARGRTACSLSSGSEPSALLAAGLFCCCPRLHAPLVTASLPARTSAFWLRVLHQAPGPTRPPRLERRLRPGRQRPSDALIPTSGDAAWYSRPWYSRPCVSSPKPCANSQTWHSWERCHHVQQFSLRLCPASHA